MNVYETIVEMVADRFNKSADELTRDTEFIADLCADSLDQIELSIASSLWTRSNWQWT